MTGRLRLLVIAAVGVLCLGLASAYFLYVRSQRPPAGAAATRMTAEAGPILAGPYVAFRDSVLGPTYGQLSAAPLSDPAGPRANLGLSCERVYATRTAGVCLFAKRGVAQTYGVTTLDAQLHPTGSSPLTGLPSRVRMSASSTLVSTTTFVTGHSYAQGNFSTETIVRRAGQVLGNIETWTSTVDGRSLQAADRNLWGVTFAADENTFYATAASGGTTWLMRGSIKDKSMTSLRTDAECPSLSPDETRVAYKKRLAGSGRGEWRLAVLDLRSGQETLLAETRSVDDQVEWLDDSRLLYAVSRPGSEATTSDVWAVPADGSGQAAVFLPEASSPAVVR